MTNKQETNTTDEAFEKLWKKDFIPSPYGVGNGFYSPASLAVSRRKDAARIIYKEAFTAGVRSRDKEVEQLREDLKWALSELNEFHYEDCNTQDADQDEDGTNCDCTHGAKAKEIIKRHGLDKSKE